MQRNVDEQRAPSTLGFSYDGPEFHGDDNGCLDHSPVPGVPEGPPGAKLRSVRGHARPYPRAMFARGTVLPPRPEPVAPPFTSDGRYIYDIEAAARLARNTFWGYRGVTSCTTVACTPVISGVSQTTLPAEVRAELEHLRDYIIVCERCLLLFLDPHRALNHASTHVAWERLPCHGGCGGFYDNDRVRGLHWREHPSCARAHPIALEFAATKALSAGMVDGAARL
ncbi:hypothetical protein AURDEDRAFT_156689 [Auricularia subglabra TFB-10046 SS5]|nr:hypothetical protein AURDEDRAFT_156689 [Auricularia subglabra TFB-10046 SS5]